MALALVIIGLALISSGVQNTQGKLTGQVAADFTGAGSFWYFIVGIITVGSIGYYQPLQGASRLLIVLVILVLLLDNTGFFAQLQAALNAPGTTAKSAANASASGTQNVGNAATQTGVNSVISQANTAIGQAIGDEGAAQSEYFDSNIEAGGVGFGGGN